MCLKPGKTSAVTMHIKCIFGVKSAKKNFLNKNFRVGPLLKGRSGNRKHKIYSIRTNMVIEIFVSYRNTLLNLKLIEICYSDPGKKGLTYLGEAGNFTSPKFVHKPLTLHLNKFTHPFTST